jgi:hypothetical protein
MLMITEDRGARSGMPCWMRETVHGRAFYDSINAVLPDGWRVAPVGDRELRLFGPDGPYATIEQEWLSDDALLANEAPWGAAGVLDLAQQEIAEETTEPWPARSGRDYRGFAEPDAVLEGDFLRMWFGDKSKPVLTLEPIDLTGVICATRPSERTLTASRSAKAERTRWGPTLGVATRQWRGSPARIMWQRLSICLYQGMARTCAASSAL